MLIIKKCQGVYNTISSLILLLLLRRVGIKGSQGFHLVVAYVIVLVDDVMFNRVLRMR